MVWRWRALRSGAGRSARLHLPRQQYLYAWSSGLNRRDQSRCHIRSQNRPIVAGDQGLELAHHPKRQLLAAPGWLAQSSPFPVEQGRTGDHQRLEAQAADGFFHLALDAVVKNLGMRISPHGADQAQPAHAGRSGRAGQSQHSVQINRTKSWLAAGHSNGGSQGNEHVIGRRHSRIKQRVAQMRHQPHVLGAGWKFRCPAAQGVDRSIGAGFIGR